MHSLLAERVVVTPKMRRMHAQNPCSIVSDSWAAHPVPMHIILNLPNSSAQALEQAMGTYEILEPQVLACDGT